MKNEQLKKARMNKKISQVQLAKLFGAQGKSSISNWENGHSTSTLETAIKISRILNENIEFLFGDKVQDSHSEKVI